MGVDYDVALSFAGEDRSYVEQVAEILHAFGLRVFYDRYVEEDLWGKDLYAHLQDVYQNKCRYCVMFISDNYRDKLWTNHERESAQARAFREKQEYILPARFDDTVIPGIQPTTAYIDLHERTPEDFARLIVKKVSGGAVVDELLNYLGDWIRHTTSIEYDIYLKGAQVIFESKGEDYYNEFPLRLLLDMGALGELERMFLNTGILIL